jgi:hypothetical protein
MPQTPPPPPYNQITGISRADMKYNEQESLTDYNGNARPGELVVDLTSVPPALYVGNNLGQLTAVGSGGGGATTWATLGNKNNASGPTAIALGQTAGNAQGAGAVAVGQNAGQATQGSEAVAIGPNAGANAQGFGSVAIGTFAGNDSQLDAAVAIGYSAGQTNQGTESVAIGFNAGASNCSGIAIGSGAGSTNNQGISIGYLSGSGGLNSIIIGTTAGTATSAGAIAIGALAAQVSQGNTSIAIGGQAVQNGPQGLSAVAIGKQAAYYGQGNSSIAIGPNAGGNTAVPNNSIVLDASGGNLPSAGANTTTIFPVRNVTSTNAWTNPARTLPTGFFFTAYNPTTGELIYWS